MNKKTPAEIEKKLRIEIYNKYKPKVLNVDKLKKEKVILTDSYSWKDLQNAIKESFEIGKKQGIELGRKESEEEKNELEFENDNLREQLKCQNIEIEQQLSNQKKEIIEKIKVVLPLCEVCKKFPENNCSKIMCMKNREMIRKIEGKK